jgi:ribosome-associated translation inhibitor RaiA
LNIPGGNALTKQVLKDTTSGQAVESAYKTAIKTGAKETVSEGAEAATIEGAVQKIIDPNADLNWKDIVSTGMLESIYGGGHSTVIAGADASLSAISQRLANVGVSQSEIDLIRKGIAESVYDGGTTLKQDRETVANYLMDRYGYTEQTAKALSDAMVDATAQVTVNSFLTDAGLDSAKIAQVSPLVLNAINTGGDINTVAQNVSSVLQNAGIEAQNALNYTKAFLPTAKVTTSTGQAITTPTVQVTKPADLTSVVTPAGGTNTAGNSTNVGGTTGSTTTTTGATTSTTGGATTGGGPTVVSTQTLANGNTSVTYSDGKVAVFDRTGTPVTSVDTSTTTGGGNVAVTADLNAVADALADLNKAVSTAQQGNTDSFSAINQAISDLKASGLTTDQVQNLIDTSVQSTNSALATAISEANKGNAQALTDLQTNINTKIDDLVKAGSTQAEATAKALSDLGMSISDVNTGLETKIGDLSTDVQSKFDSMSEAQKALVETQVQQGKDLTQAINDVSTNLSSELKTGLAELSTDVTSKFDALSEAQKSEVAARVQMGEDINSAINDVSTKLESSISDLSTDVETKFDALSQSQTEMSTQFNSRVDELVQQGKTYQEATDLALKEINTDITGITTDMARQEAGRRIAQKAASEKAAKEKGLAAATALVSTAAEGSTDQDPAKFKKPFQTTGEGEKFEGPLEKFLKQARQGSFVPDEGKQGKQVPITEVTDRLERPQGQPAQQDGYYNYGQASDIDQILNPDAVNESLFQKDTLGAKAGGLMSTPLMATGGSMTGTRYGQYAGGGLNVVHHSGKARVDFRRGDAVTGPGDGQSDDIPAMLADGEFVIPADVVAALGNGSTKAGSDKLYDMMHSVRAYHRSAKPKDLPPPAKKSPLDYLKDTKRKARG